LMFAYWSCWIWH